MKLWMLKLMDLRLIHRSHLDHLLSLKRMEVPSWFHLTQIWLRVPTRFKKLRLKNKNQLTNLKKMKIKVRMKKMTTLKVSNRVRIILNQNNHLKSRILQSHHLKDRNPLHKMIKRMVIKNLITRVHSKLWSIMKYNNTQISRANL